MAAVPATVTTAALQCTIHRHVVYAYFFMMLLKLRNFCCHAVPSRETLPKRYRRRDPTRQPRQHTTDVSWERTQQQRSRWAHPHLQLLLCMQMFRLLPQEQPWLSG